MGEGEYYSPEINGDDLVMTEIDGTALRGGIIGTAL